jgi:cytochrome c
MLNLARWVLNMKQKQGVVVRTAFIKAVLLGTSVVAAYSFAAESNGTEAEAEALVKKGQALIKSVGVEKAFATLNSGAPDYIDRDLYLYVYDFEGNCLVQAVNTKMVSKNLMDLKDTDGNYLIRGQINMVKEKSKGWYGPYKFSNPATKQYSVKMAYCEQVPGQKQMICTGIYPKNS